MKTINSFYASMLLLGILTVQTNNLNGQGPGGHGSIGVRIGYDGAANGFSYTRQIGDALGIECAVGYNDKQGRRLDVPLMQKGNTMINLNLTPYFFKRGHRTPATIYSSVGVGARVHHYRMQGAFDGTNGGGSVVTLDKRAGLGLLISPIRSVEAFMEIHVKHYNTAANYGSFGTESGIGLRLALGRGTSSKEPRIASAH